MQKILGTIVSNLDSPTTTKFSFLVKEAALKGSYVQVTEGDRKLVGVVTELQKFNKYFERVEAIADYEKTNSFSNQFPVKEWEYLTANCAILGEIKDERISRAKTPPSPGTNVEEVELELLKKFLGLKHEGLQIGKLMQHDLSVSISMPRLLQKHLAILAVSGAGKSNLCAVILEELLSRKKGQGRIATVVFDLHNEYSSFAKSDLNFELSQKSCEIKCEKTKISAASITPELLQELFEDLSATQAREFSKVITGLRSAKRASNETFDLDELIENISKSEMKENVKIPLLSWLQELKRENIFDRVDYPNLKETVKQGTLTIFNMSEVLDSKKRMILFTHTVKKLFELRRKGEIPPILVVVEEAHNFAAEREKKSSMSKNIIETIAREGRKFGMSLCLISQRPVQLSTTALSQCNSMIILKITNPYDLQHIATSCESLDQSTINSLTTLSVGEGVVIGEAVNFPTMTKFRERTSRKSKSHDLEEMAKEFEEIAERKQLKKDDINGFV